MLHTGFAVTIVIALSPQATWSPQGREEVSYSLARRIPRATVYVRCPDLAATKKGLENLAIAKLCENPEVEAFLRTNPDLDRAMHREVGAEIRDTLMRENPELTPELIDDMTKLVTALEGEVAFAVVPAGENGENSVCASAYLGESLEFFNRTLRSAFDLIRSKKGAECARRVAQDGVSYYEFEDPEGTPLRVGRCGKTAVAGFAEPPFMSRLLRAPEGPSLADSPSFREADTLFSSRPGAVWAYVDGPPLVANMIIESTPGEGLRPLDIDRLRWAGLSVEPDGEYLRHRLEMRTSGAEGFLTLFSSKEKFDLAASLPKSTVACLQLALDGAATFRALRAMSAKLSPKGAAGFDRDLREMRTRIGIDVEDVAKRLGSELVLAATVPEGSLFPEFYLIVRGGGDDPKAASTILASVLETAVRRSKPGMSPREMTYDGKRLVYFISHGAPIVPTMTVVDDLVVIGSNVASVKRYIGFRKSGAESLSKNPGYSESINAVRSGSATAYLWIDWPKIVGFTYSNLAALLEVIGSARLDPHASLFPFDFSKLPSADVVVEHVRPQAVRFRLNDQGVSIESRAIF